jgi:outer membrane protein OmpA-like peptidoglycan-associated protein
MKKPLLSMTLVLTAMLSQAQTRISIAGGLHSTSVTPLLRQDTAAMIGSTETKQTSLHFGFVADLPINNSKRLSFQTGILYSGRSIVQEQLLDTSKRKFFKATTEQKINYVDVPMNLVAKLPLKGKTKFILGAGPQASIFYNGASTYSTVDTFDKYQADRSEDLPVGKGRNQYRLMHFSINALAGLEFKKVYLTVNYSKGISPFYEWEGQQNKYGTVAATLGIFLGKTSTTKKPASPVADNARDKDAIINADDLCPDQAGIFATKGCPDKDGDGIADAQDKCPETAGLSKYGGCPIPDRDKDGINDELDQCPDIAGIAKYNGCPIPDADKDGVNDEEDKCVNEPGTKANNGCPEIKKEIVEKVSLAARQIQFKVRSDVLTAPSLKVLDEVVEALKSEPGVQITVEGHSSLDGTAEANLLLSQKRADNVKRYMVSKGIPAERITAIGYGATRPLSMDTTDAAANLNRRVEIKLAR